MLILINISSQNSWYNFENLSTLIKIDWYWRTILTNVILSKEGTAKPVNFNAKIWDWFSTQTTPWLSTVPKCLQKHHLPSNGGVPFQFWWTKTIQFHHGLQAGYSLFYVSFQRKIGMLVFRSLVSKLWLILSLLFVARLDRVRYIFSYWAVMFKAGLR